MRRFVALILMLLFAANVGGVTVTHHLCGKLSQYVSITGKKKHHGCCCKGASQDKGCCKTKVTKLKLDEKQTLAKTFCFAETFHLDALPPTFAILHEAPLEAGYDVAVPQLANPPPLLASVKLHVLYGVFLI